MVDPEDKSKKREPDQPDEESWAEDPFEDDEADTQHKGTVHQGEYAIMGQEKKHETEAADIGGGHIIHFEI